jgi:hypothetical protein
MENFLTQYKRRENRISGFSGDYKKKERTPAKHLPCIKTTGTFMVNFPCEIPAFRGLLDQL